MKDVLNRIRLFIGNVWMILAVDPLHKIIFSFWCAAFSLFAAEVMRNAFTRVLIDLGGIKYIDKSNMLQACTSKRITRKNSGNPTPNKRDIPWQDPG